MRLLTGGGVGNDTSFAEATNVDRWQPSSDILQDPHTKSQLPHSCHSNEVQHFQRPADRLADTFAVRIIAVYRDITQNNLKSTDFGAL